jgi:hypothetical protein
MTLTHQATTVLTLGSQHLRAVPIHPGQYSPWTVTSPDYRSHRTAFPACGSAQHPALFGDGVGGCASVSPLRPVVHESNSDGRNVGNAQIQVGELRNV